jgi:glucose/arabinose dehydrogenase
LVSEQVRGCIRALGRSAQVLLLALLPLACSASQKFSADDEVRVVETEEHRLAVSVVVDGLKQAWSVAELPDGSLLVTEKNGLLHHIDPASGDGGLIEGVPDSVKHGQGGLLDVRPHPDFETNRWLYLSYSIERDGGYATRVARGRLGNDRLEDLEVLFTAEPARDSGRHFGSDMVFDQDGYLYITSGERGSRPLIQELSNHLGKIIRLHDDGAVPEDNPFVGAAGARPEVYSYGHRNPQGIALEPGSGALWSVEHGPRGGDELNLIEAGANYGWPVITYGEEYRGGKIGEGTHKAGMKQPVHYYVPSIATSGMAFYSGDAFPGWRGNVFIGALVQTHVNRLVLEQGRVVHEERLLEDWGLRIRDVEAAADGSLYVLADKGPLLKLSPADGPRAAAR